MATHIKVENLTVIFGSDKQKKAAIDLMDSGSTVEDIKKETGATVANKNVNFEIEENELFVIVGLSGSGKSTFIRTLNLLNKPTRGRVIVGDKDITKMTKLELQNYRRKDVSMIFQHFGLFSHRSVLENVEYPLEIQGLDKKMRRIVSMEAIEKVGLNGWEHNMPSELSGGMRQRVGLARALTNDPQLLLMDEPYSALDPLIRREMQNELLTMEDDISRTIIFITHDMNEAFRMGDRIALMKDGEVVQIGTPDQFFAKPANDYVKDFIADVDKSRILKVRSIMRKPKHIALTTDSVESTLEMFIKDDLQFCYVVDEEKKLIGFISREVLEKTKNKTLRALVETQGYIAMHRNTYLKDAWNPLQEADYDVAIVDSKNRLRGVLGYAEILGALSD